MALIEVETRINAPVERVFDLARSIDAHTSSTEHTNERAVAGRTSGLFELDETVTWEAKHFGVKQLLTVKMTAFDRPNFFEDKLIKGSFKSMTHRHSFQADGDVTVMKDEFEFCAPLGFLGRIAEKVFLTKYMKWFIIRRNEELKQMAESGEWRQFLGSTPEQSDQ